MTNEKPLTFFGNPLVKDMAPGWWESPWEQPFYLKIRPTRTTRGKRVEWILVIGCELPGMDVCRCAEVRGQADTVERCCRLAEEAARRLLECMQEQVRAAGEELKGAK